jgi:hypothetical protein
MNDLLDPKSTILQASKEQQKNRLSESGLYVKEDDQDWGSAGMNDIQKDSK